MREELWTSFQSLLRAYLAAASIGSEIPQALLLEPEPGRLQIIGAHRTIKLELQPASGEGYWAVYGTAAGREAAVPHKAAGVFDVASEASLLDEGAFRLHLDAEFEWSGKAGRLPIDQVAEALAMLAFE